MSVTANTTYTAYFPDWFSYKLEQFVSFGFFFGTFLPARRLVPMFYCNILPAGAKKQETKKNHYVTATIKIATVHLTSIHPLQFEAKSLVSAAGLTNLFMVALTSLLSELVNATIKKGMAPLENGPTFGFN
jgi:hypothetical protein